MKSSLLKYKIGLAAVGVFTVVLVVYVLMQAGATKQDTQTNTAVDGIISKLSSYIGNHGTIPDSLQAAGIHAVPAAISYTKLSEQSYKFCITYKTADSGLNSSSITDTLLKLSGPIDPGAQLDNSTTTAYLTVPYTHHKGVNCQMVTPPDLYNFEDNSNNYNYNDSFGNSTLQN